jgi:hypothetical protein
MPYYSAETFAKLKQRSKSLPLQSCRPYAWFCCYCGNGSTFSAAIIRAQIADGEMIDYLLASFALMLLLCDGCGQEVSVLSILIVTMLRE